MCTPVADVESDIYVDLSNEELFAMVNSRLTALAEALQLVVAFVGDTDAQLVTQNEHDE